MRPSVHGDVVHSRPLAINYGTDAAPQVVVFYGGNDGMLRAVNGNRDGGLPINNVSAMVPGMELWSFVAPEHFDKLKRLKSNAPDVLFTGATYDPADPNPALKDYYFDGSIGVHRNGGNVWIYPTMRRGGRYVYAFDVSTPTNPSLKWKRGPAELDNVGQTWSEPKVIKVAGYPTLASTTKSPVIIMGGGYDPCEDQDAAPNTTCSTTPKGNRIFVLDADTGAVLQTLGTGVGDGDAILRSIAADITVVDSDGDSYVDMAYAVDTGANVYRIDIGSNTPGDAVAKWSIKRIASLGCASSASCSRKFLHAPEVVVGASSNAVLVGSGNRERPLLVNEARNVDNAFFMIKDDRTSTQDLITTDNLVSVNPDTGVGTAPVSTPNKGWQLVFGSGTHDQEQVVTSAVVVAGVAYFSTHTPPVPSSCDLGKARGYGVNYLDGSSPDGGPMFNVFAGGGLPPSPVAGIVSLTLSNEDGTTKTDAGGNPVTANVPFIIGGGGVSGIDPTLVEVNPSGVRGRVYWYLEQ
jgi:type IV pilus assembly protein PilY1